MTILRYERNNHFCLRGSADRTEATGNAVFVPTDMQLGKVGANAFHTKKGSTHMAAPPCRRFVSLASLNVDKNPMIEI